MKKSKLILAICGLFLFSGLMFYVIDNVFAADEDANVEVELTVTNAYQFRMTWLDLNSYEVSLTGYTCNASSCAISGSIDATWFVVKDFNGTDEWLLELKSADLTNANWNVIKSGNVLIKMDNIANYTGSSHCFADTVFTTGHIIQTEVTTTYQSLSQDNFILFWRDGTVFPNYGTNTSGDVLTVTGSLCKFAIKKAGTDNGLRIGLKIDAGTPAGSYSGDITITDSLWSFAPTDTLSY